MKANRFDATALFATPEVVEKLSPIAPVGMNQPYDVQILGPRRLMPSMKNGTVSDNVEEAIRVVGSFRLHP